MINLRITTSIAFVRCPEGSLCNSTSLFFDKSHAQVCNNATLDLFRMSTSPASILHQTPFTSTNQAPLQFFDVSLSYLSVRRKASWLRETMSDVECRLLPWKDQRSRRKCGRNLSSFGDSFRNTEALIWYVFLRNLLTGDSSKRKGTTPPTPLSRLFPTPVIPRICDG